MKRGFPRPKTQVDELRYYELYSDNSKWENRQYPHPYTASDDDVASIDTNRLKQSVTFKLCGVCGEPVHEKDVGLILFNPESDNHTEWEKKNIDWIMSESGPYHLPCLVLAFKTCPHLADTDKYFPGYGTWKVVRPMILAHVK